MRPGPGPHAKIGVSMKIAIGADHAGFELKEHLKRSMAAEGHSVEDLGTYDTASTDYPDYAAKVAHEVAQGKADRGILVCMTGMGMAMAANKVKGIRAGLCHDHYSVRQGVEDDDMNVLCLGGRVMGIEVAWDHVQTFISSTFSNAERHCRRLSKVARLETSNATQEA